MNVSSFLRANNITRTSVMIAKGGELALNALLRANNHNGVVGSVRDMKLVVSADSALSLQIRVDCTTTSGDAVVVWINANEDNKLEFDFS